MLQPPAEQRGWRWRLASSRPSLPRHSHTTTHPPTYTHTNTRTHTAPPGPAAIVAVRQQQPFISEAEVFEALEKIHRDKVGRAPPWLPPRLGAHPCARARAPPGAPRRPCCAPTPAACGLGNASRPMRGRCRTLRQRACGSCPRSRRGTLSIPPTSALQLGRGGTAAVNYESDIVPPSMRKTIAGAPPAACTAAALPLLHISLALPSFRRRHCQPSASLTCLQPSAPHWPQTSLSPGLQCTRLGAPWWATSPPSLTRSSACRCAPAAWPPDTRTSCRW